MKALTKKDLMPYLGNGGGCGTFFQVTTEDKDTIEGTARSITVNGSDKIDAFVVRGEGVRILNEHRVPLRNPLREMNLEFTNPEPFEIEDRGIYYIRIRSLKNEVIILFAPGFEI